MARQNTLRACILGLGVLVVAVAIPAVSGAVAAGRDRPVSLTPTDSAVAEAVPDAGATQPIVGTELAVPVPDPKIGSEVHDLEIPLQESDAVVHGVAFYRPGPMNGSVIGGVSVVFDDSAAVRDADGGLADAGTIAKRVNPQLSAKTYAVAGRTVLAWPDSERVPSVDIPQDDRTISRYVVILDDGIAMVTFDDVPTESAEAYLAAVAGAL